MQGASRYQGNGGDVDIYHSPDAPLLCGEVKARVNGKGFATLERWLGDNDFLLSVETTPSHLSLCLGRSGRDSLSEVD
jgi:hypothetical protein